jgi:hypothetical protein
VTERARDVQGRDASGKGDEREFLEAQDSLWRITLGPLIWAIHFVVCYAAAAVACAKFPGDTAIFTLRVSLGAVTLAALAAIAWLGVRAWREWDYRGPQNRPGEAEDRRQFLNHAALLLVVVSFIGVIFVALPLGFAGTCR